MDVYNLAQAVNELRARLPSDNAEKMDQVMAFLDCINDGQGPGYSLGGQVIHAGVVTGVFLPLSALLATVCGISLSDLM